MPKEMVLADAPVGTAGPRIVSAVWRLVVLIGVIAIAAGLAAAGGVGSDGAPLASSVARRAEVVCGPTGTIVRTDRVLPLRDGVHVTVENPASAERLEIRSASDTLLAELPVTDDRPTEATFALPPGPMTVTCSSDGAVSDAGVLTVLDPQERWISPELTCDGETPERAELVATISLTERAQSTARRAVPNLRGSDELETPGYPGSRWHGDLLIVVRDGRTIGRITRAQEGGAWHVFLEWCPSSGLGEG
jgi:hypothetical protein